MARLEALDKTRTPPNDPNNPNIPNSNRTLRLRLTPQTTLPLYFPKPLPNPNPNPPKMDSQEQAPKPASTEAETRKENLQEPAPGASASGLKATEVKSADIKKLEDSLKSTSLEDADSDAKINDITVINREGAIASSTPLQERVRLPRMGGAMKKRCLRYLDQGLPLSEALEKAKTPLGPATMPPKPKGSVKGTSQTATGDGKAKKEAEKTPSEPPKPGKRKRVDATNSPADNKGEGKRPRDKSPSKPFSKRPSYREVVGSTKLGIMPTDFPDRKMEKEDLERAIQVIKRYIIEQSESNIKPRFAQQLYLKNGIVICVCKDAETVTWMTNQTWGSEGWTVKEESDFPIQDILIGYFLGAEKDSNEDILRMVQGQNHNLATTGWNVVSRKNVKSTAVLTLTVDSTSMERLQQRKFTVEFGFGAVVRLHRVSKQAGEAKVPESQGASAVATNAGGSTEMEQN